MAAIAPERVLTVHHWNETVFSFTTTRDQSLRFENGHFIMLGLQVDGKPLMRAYSIASANHEEYLEFLSIKVADGPLTSRLQNIKPGDEVLVSRKPTGTLLLHDLRPGKRLYLLSSGTGLAPFMSLIKDPAAYERFEKIILVHGVRYRSELAYRDFIEWELTHHEYLGEQVRSQLVYYPTVTRRTISLPGPRHLADRERQIVQRHRHAAARSRPRSGHDLRQPRHAGGPVRAARCARLPDFAACGRARRLRDREIVRGSLETPR